jgi:hypothetical protein
MLWEFISYVELHVLTITASLFFLRGSLQVNYRMIHNLNSRLK